MKYPEAQEAYQAYLEGHRMYPDDEDIFVDLQRARVVRDAAWQRHVVGMEDGIEVNGVIL